MDRAVPAALAAGAGSGGSAPGQTVHPGPGRRRVAFLGRGDEEHEHLARLPVGQARADMGEVLRIAAAVPGAGTRGPGVEFGWRVALGQAGAGPHHPRVGEIGGEVAEGGMFVRVRTDQGDVVSAQQGQQSGGEQRRVAQLQRVAQRPPAGLARQQPGEGVQRFQRWALAAVELPQDRAQAVAERGDALHEVLHLGAGTGQLPAGHDPLGCLGGEHEPGRGLIAPAGVGVRLLRAVIGAVDLDRRELAAGVLQLAALHQLFRVEHAAAPWRVGPATDADPDARAVVRSGRRGIEQVGHGGLRWGIGRGSAGDRSRAGARARARCGPTPGGHVPGCA